MISFLLGYNKLDKKQKFSAPDIVESGSKDVWSLSYTIYFFICRYTDTEI